MDECGGHGQGHEEGESVACRLVHASYRPAAAPPRDVARTRFLLDNSLLFGLWRVLGNYTLPLPTSGAPLSSTPLSPLHCSVPNVTPPNRPLLPLLAMELDKDSEPR
ncbi:unnamed protein product [Spodoptera exigua]|nr:unnamed protein product [Spodoptera exigua]